MTEKREFDFEEFKKEAIKGMYAGKPMNGEKGIFAPLLGDGKDSFVNE